MNSNTLNVIVKKKLAIINFHSLTMSENGLILKCKSKQTHEISFSQLEKIYVIIYKFKSNYLFLIVLLQILIALLVFLCIQINIEFSLALLLVTPSIEKRNHFIRFGLIIVLKDGCIFKKQVPKKIKSETVDLIRKVKKKMLEPK